MRDLEREEVSESDLLMIRADRAGSEGGRVGRFGVGCASSFLPEVGFLSDPGEELGEELGGELGEEPGVEL